MAESFSQNSWMRLKKNKGALVGLLIIFFSVLVGLFAYFIAPDSTPDADRQIVEIQARKPGFKQLFLKINKEKKIESTGFFSRLLYGAEDKYIYLPINSFGIMQDSVVVEKYIDEDLQERQSLSLIHISEPTRQ